MKSAGCQRVKNKLARPINRSAISRLGSATLVFFLLSVIVAGQPLGRYFLLAKIKIGRGKKRRGRAAGLSRRKEGEDGCGGGGGGGDD